MPQCIDDPTTALPQNNPETAYVAPEMPRRPYNQACALQRVAWELAHNPDTKQSTVALLMRAWDTLEERKRVLKMQAAPKPIDVADLERNKAKARAARAGARPPGWRPKVVPKGSASGPANAPEVRPADADASPGAS